MTGTSTVAPRKFDKFGCQPKCRISVVCRISVGGGGGGEEEDEEEEEEE